MDRTLFELVYRQMNATIIKQEKREVRCITVLCINVKCINMKCITVNFSKD